MSTNIYQVRRGGDSSVLDMRNTSAVRPPMFVEICLVCFQYFSTCLKVPNILLLSCVSSTALPVVGLTILAMESRVRGYRTLLSALLPDLFPNGKSVMMTSTELSFKQGARQSHWKKSAGGCDRRLFFSLKAK